MNVYAFAITTGISFITSTAAWDFPSTAITSFLVDSFYLRPNITTNNLIITNIYAPVSKMARMALSFTLMYILIEVYCRDFSYFSVILI